MPTRVPFIEGPNSKLATALALDALFFCLNSARFGAPSA
jgi:hypothetical protein